MRINSSFSHLSSNLIPALQNSQFAQVISRNKKILAIVAAILSSFVVGYAIYNCCFKAKPQAPIGSRSESTPNPIDVLPSKENDKVQKTDVVEPVNQKPDNQKDAEQDVPKNTANASADESSESTTVPNSSSAILSPTPSEDKSSSSIIEEKPVVEEELVVIDEVEKEVTVVETEEDKKKKKIIEDFGAEMVEALGGVDRVLSLPICENLNLISIKNFTAPVMYGYVDERRPFLVFCSAKCETIEVKGVNVNEFKIRQLKDRKENENLVKQDILRLRMDCLERKEDGKWGAGFGWANQMNLAFNTPIGDETPKAKYFFDRIKRFMNFEPLGNFANRSEFDPNRAYLKGVDVEEFMKLDTSVYETTPPEGSTEIFQWDPSKDQDQNLANLDSKFPENLVNFSAILQ